MLAKDYAQALYQSINNKPDDKKEEIFNDFIGLLNKKGHIKLLPKILNNFEELIGEEENLYIEFIGAKEGDKDTCKKELVNYKEYLSSDAKVKIWLDKNIVGGFIIRTKDLIIDRSYKTALLDLYSNISK